MPVPRRKALSILLQAALLLVVGAYAVDALRDYWLQYRGRAPGLRLDWTRVLASGLVFLAAHAVLVATWRAVVAAWGSQLSFVVAARIWLVSSLARYVPGKLWQIAAMGVMARDAGVSPVAATGAAVIGTVVNIAAGFVVALALAPRLLEAVHPGASRIGLLLLAASVAGLLLLPVLLPRVLDLAARATGRDLGVGPLPLRAVLVALMGNVIAWILYGLAFRVLAQGVLGTTSGGASDWIAVYAISYVFGYIILFAPAGAVAREVAMVAALAAAGLANPVQAGILAVASRLWLTILEIVPGLVFLASGALRRREPTLGPPDAPR